jgi:HEPN domain-containing protein
VREEARRWLKQAESDLELARRLGHGHYYIGAFACHQAIEKSMKAAFIERKRAMPPKTHNLIELAKELEAPELVLSDIRLINPEYVVSRYPDAANGIPAEMYDERKVEFLLEVTERIWSWVISVLTGKA